MPKGKKAAYALCQELLDTEIVQKWKEQGFADDELIKLMADFKKIAKDRKPNKKEIKAGITDVGGKGDDCITRDEFAKNFSKKMKVTVKDANKLFAQADVDQNGFLDINEFFTIVGVIRKGDPKQKMELAFKMYDTKTDGKLNKDEIRAMLELMVTIEDEEIKTKKIEDALASLLAATDANGDQKISLPELTSAMESGGLLAVLGDNVTRKQAADAMLDTGLSKQKSSMCLVM